MDTGKKEWKTWRKYIEINKAKNLSVVMNKQRKHES